MNSNTAVRVLQPLAPSANANPLDVVKIKSALGALGHYEAPDWGLSQFPDPALFKAIQAFQRKRGLAVDGMMKPGGPTEASLRAALTPQQTDAALYATAQTIRALGRHGDTLLAHITPEEAHLLDAVTDGASINPATGLLEFWSTKGGYSGPDRTYASKHSDGGDSFDASADHKAMQRSVMTRNDNGGRNDFDARATGGQETLGSGNSLTAQSAARTAPSAAPTDTEARTRAARAVIAPDNDPSFSRGFFEKKDAPVKSGGATSGMLSKSTQEKAPNVADAAMSSSDTIGGFRSGPTTRGGARGQSLKPSVSPEPTAITKRQKPEWNLLERTAIQTSHLTKMLGAPVDTAFKTMGRELWNGGINLKNGCDALLGDGINYEKDKMLKDFLASGITTERANSVAGKFGTAVGSGLRFAGSMTNFGLGGVVAGVGEDVANARARGVIGAALDKVAKQSLGKNVAANMIGGVAGRVGGGMAIANVAKFTPSKAGMLVKASELFADVAVSEGLMALAGRDKGRQPSKVAKY